MTEAKLKAIIEESNTRYDNATITQKRVLVAQDAIDLMRDELIESKTSNTYIDVAWADDATAFSTVFTQENLITHKLQGTSCRVCAKGALVLAKQRVGNRLNNINNFDFASHNPLKDIFSTEEWDLIESLFENISLSSEVGNLNEKVVDTITAHFNTAIYELTGIMGTYERFSSCALYLVMQLIVASNGRFRANTWLEIAKDFATGKRNIPDWVLRLDKII